MLDISEAPAARSAETKIKLFHVLVLTQHGRIAIEDHGVGIAEAVQQEILRLQEIQS